MRPLYLTACGGFQVSLDGPALRVTHDRRATAWFPLARVLRVVSRGDNQWSMPALLACAEQGIGVTFVTREGDLRGHFLGRSPRQADLSYRLRGLLARADWPELYRDWLAGLRSRHPTAPDSRLVGLCTMRPDARQFQGLLRQALVGRVPVELLDAMRGRLAALVAALVSQVLEHYGLSPETLIGPLARLDLHGALSEELVTDLDLELLRVVRGRQAERALARWREDRSAVALFESQSASLAQTARATLGRLDTWSLEVLA